MPATLEARINERIGRLQSAGLYRKLSAPSGIDFSSNDYLGLARHPVIQRRMADAVEEEGCGSTGSRLLRGERATLSALESRFAKFKGAEAALYFSSGYLANLAVLSTFPEAGDIVLSDSLNHASLIDGMRLSKAAKRVFPHSDVRALYAALDASCGEGQRFVVAESVFSMDGDFAPLEAYAALAKDKGAVLIVDEAHAVGIYGERGSGCIESNAFLTINPMGKAFGVAGAFVCGPAWAIEFLVQRARPFVFSTAPPPAVAVALDAALDLVEHGQDQRDRLLYISRFLRGLLADMGLDVSREGSQIIPVVIGDNFRAMAVAARLQEAGFDVRAIRPPSVPHGTARLRISLNTGLTETILRDFAGALVRAIAA
jgi:8-amino-7-oxononanoate synthase